MKDDLTGIMVVKIGGVALGKGDTTLSDIVEMQLRGVPLVIIHGGGNTVTEWMKRQQIETRFVRGERYTDGPALETVAAVLKGVINARLTAAVNAIGGRAVGLTGIDGAILKSVLREDMGYVGKIINVDVSLLRTLLLDGQIPVLAPLSQRIVDGEPEPPNYLNVNGDIAAGEIAATIGASKLVFMTDVPGIKDARGHVIDHLSGEEAAKLIEIGLADGGMIPKITAARRALSAGAVARIIDGTVPHALLGELEDGHGGTTICKNNVEEER